MAQRSELGEKEAAEGRELFLLMERGQRRGWVRESTPHKSSWRESGKVEIAAGTELEREKGERRGSQDGRTAWKFFVCLASMKYSQTNAKPSRTPRKLI